jgi:hypothetical protein
MSSGMTIGDSRGPTLSKRSLNVMVNYRKDMNKHQSSDTDADTDAIATICRPYLEFTHAD